MAKTVLLDMNIALDSLLQRQPFNQESNAIIKAHAEGKITAYLAAFSVSTIFYILSREFRRNLSQRQAAIQALTGVMACLTDFEICPVDGAMIEEAVKMHSIDFEDNLQLACAHAAGLDAMVTRDRRIIDPGLTILSPAQLLQQI